MSPKAILAALLALVLVVVGLAILRGGPAAPPPKSPSSSRLTREKKDRIRRFWNTYREAKALKLAGKWEEAIPKYRQALALDDVHEDTLYNLANCHFELDRFQEALGYLKRLVEVNPMSNRGNLQMGAILAYPQAGDTFDLAAAEAALNRAFEINQEESGSILRLGELALVKGEDGRAFELLALANQSNFRAVEGYYLRAYVRWKEGRREETLTLLQEARRQSEKPVVVAEVPGEGDTRIGSSLPPTTLDRKLLIKPTWLGLVERYPDGRIGAESLDAEFGPLKTYLSDLTARIKKGATPK